ncbi:MAG TPA: DNA polymerase III subunit delta [Dehalococcoidia bacterium]|nr:DNA polymerase III subunit delta [Dehalococcoidia bacterium]
MIHLIHGKDRYLARQALREIRDQLGDDDMLETNTAVLNGSAVTPGELLANAQAVPFLAPARLVIVEGLLAHIGGGRRGRRSAKKKADANDPLAPWEELAAQLKDPATLPPTTTLIFFEGELTKTNPAFTLFAPVAKVRDCDALDAQALPPWIEHAAQSRELALTHGAVKSIAVLTAGDLWAIENELDKLAAYAGGRTVDERMVHDVVSSAQEARIWDLTDAVVAGNESKALSAMGALLEDGQAAQLLLFMLVRQYRQIAVVKDMRERRLRQDEMARGAGLPPFRVNAVTGLASRYGWATIREAYAILLDADLSVKRGRRDDEAALQLAVHQLCALARRGATTGAYRRPAASPRA